MDESSSSEEIKETKVNKNVVDLSEQDQEFIIEARECVLNALDGIEKNEWPTTRNTLSTFIQKNSEVTNRLDPNTIVGFLIHCKIIEISSNGVTTIDTKLLHDFDFKIVLKLMKELNKILISKSDKLLQKFATEIIISESTVLAMQKVIAYLKLNLKNFIEYKKNATVPLNLKALDNMVNKVAEECVVDIVVSPDIIIEELKEMNFLKIEISTTKTEENSKLEEEKLIEKEKEVIEEKSEKKAKEKETNNDSDDESINTIDNRDGIVKYTGNFLSGGSSTLMGYIKPIAKLLILGLFWTSMLQMALPKMGGM